MSQLKKSFHRIEAFFNESGFRQRIMILISILIIIHSLWDFYIYQPQIKKFSIAEKKLTLEKKYIDSLLKESNKKYIKNENYNNEQIEKLKKQISNLEAEVETAMSSLVTPKQMPRLLKSLVDSEKYLKIVDLKTEPPIKVNKINIENDAEQEIYKHKITMKFEGSYIEMNNYIKSIEELESRVFWDSVKIESKNYPISTISISVYTLSLKKENIGV